MPHLLPISPKEKKLAWKPAYTADLLFWRLKENPSG